MADETTQASVGAVVPQESLSSGRTDDTRQRILETARRLVQKDGLPALTVGNVAAQAGVYKAAVSYHFGGKAGLMASLVTGYFDEIDARIAKAAQACPAGRERVRFILEHWLDFVDPEEDLLFFDVLGYVVRERDMHDQLRGLYQRWTDLILSLLRDATTAEDPEGGRRLALLVRMLIDGMVVERLVHPERSDWRTATEGLEQLLRLYSSHDQETVPAG